MTTLTRSYFRNSALAIIVFDVTQKATFASVPKWIDIIRSNLTHDTLILVVGNKADQASLYRSR